LASRKFSVAKDDTWSWLDYSYRIDVYRGQLIFASGAIWFESHETSNRGLKLWALCSTGSLALLVGYWLAKRIELPRETNDIDDDDDDE
jgi:hypothetical protein